MAPDRELVSVQQTDLLKHQLRFITYGNSKNGQWVGEWSREQSAAASADHVPENGKLSSPTAPSNLRHASFWIVQAPACWSKPVTQKKPFQPPFKIRLDLRYTGQLQVPVKVGAIAMPEQSADLLVKQQGDGVLVPTQLLEQNDLENASISSCIQTRDESTDDTTEKFFSEDLEFTELRFSKSSRMNRRWVLFTCRLGWDMLYCLYRLPTIVLSRKTDQYEKACGILRQRALIDTIPIGAKLQLNSPKYFCSSTADVQQGWKSDQIMQGLISKSSQPFGSPPGSCVSPHCIPQDVVQQYIWDKYIDSGLRRSLIKHELVALGRRAGLVPFPPDGISAGGRATSHTWLEFQCWFDACLKSLKLVDHLWSATDIVRICSFIVDRDLAEQLLSDSAHGTFVVRLCSVPGALAISIKVHELGMAPEVKHVLIDALDLQQQPFEFWVAATEWAQNLLDVQSGDRIPKSIAFGGQLFGIANSPSDLGSCLHQPAQLFSPSPPLSSTTNIDPGTPSLSLDCALSEETVGHGITIPMSPAVLPQQLVQHQYDQTVGPPQGLCCSLDALSCTDLESLIGVTRLTSEELRVLKSDLDRREMLLKKRASSNSIDAKICAEDRPNKRRMLGVANVGFAGDSGMLLSLPSSAINQPIGVINEIRNVNM